ncbi:MAG: DUF58 domain-containing protein [Planctomycetota bacterium]
MARLSVNSDNAGVYVTLEEMVKLRYQAQGFSFLPRQPIHSLLAGRHASRLRGRGLNFEEIRRYLPGDDIRNMDWKVTARTQKPHTRVYTEERDRPAILLVDQSLSMFFGSRVNMKSVTAAQAAALAAWRIVGVGDRVGAVVFNDSEISEVKPHRSQKTVMRILQSILKQNHKLNLEHRVQSSPEMLNTVLERLVNRVGHDYLICIISDLAGANSETKRLVSLLAQHNDVMVAMIYDALETKLPQAGRLVISDGAVQLEVDTQGRKFQRDFSELFNDRLKHAHEWLGKRGIPILPLHTAENVAVQVRSLLGYSMQTKRA